MDSEFRPSNIRMTSRIALIQIGTRTKVFLLDVTALTLALSTEDWKLLVYDYFMRKEVIILGFGLHNDLLLLAKTLPEAFGDVETRYLARHILIYYNNIAFSQFNYDDVSNLSQSLIPVPNL